MKRKGFTLIELLAVIVILAIIALISTPIIIGVIEKARKGAFEDSAYGVLDAGRIYFVDKLADQNKFEGATFNFPDGGDLKVSGEKPAGGTLSLDNTGKQAIALFDKDKKWCALKTYDEEKITIKEYKADECKVSGNSGGSTEEGGATIVDKNTSGNTEGLFTDDFGNTRYRGVDPKNYVTFNNELWRIIGVFDGKIRLMRASIIPNPNDGTLPYNPGNPDGFKWSGVLTQNNWSTSDLKGYLNGTYYNSLTAVAKGMIEETQYKLGAVSTANIINRTVKELYEFERGTTVAAGRPTEWTGNIALMYPSDYGYAVGTECTEIPWNFNNANCKNNDWIYKNGANLWTLTSISNSDTDVVYIDVTGYVRTNHATNGLFSVAPVVYLKSNVKITGGDGTSSNPYQLTM